VLGSTGRHLDRVRALSLVDLPAEQLAVLIVCYVCRVLDTATFPALYVLDTPEQPLQDFTVWIGADTLTAEMRMLLGAGIWPGPEHMPSPAQLARDRTVDPVVGVSLWGEGAETKWSPLWRERNVKHGLYAAFVAKSGRVAVMLTHRDNDGAPFTPAELEFVRACIPYVSHALDRTCSLPDMDWRPVDMAHVRFDAADEISAVSYGGSEFLRDLGGGHPGADAAAREMIKRAMLAFEQRLNIPEEPVSLEVVAGGPEARAFRESQVRLSLATQGGRNRRTLPGLLTETGLGRFELWPSILIGRGGEMELCASLTRFVPGLILQLRGALQVSASAREIQLLCELAGAGTLGAAAERMNITEGTARTLAKRLAERVDESGLHAAVAQLVALGRAHWP
jgi:hypothetical protein